MIVTVALVVAVAMTLGRLLVAMATVRMTMRVITRVHVITHYFIQPTAFLNGRLRFIVRMFGMRCCRIECMRETRANIRLFRAIV